MRHIPAILFFLLILYSCRRQNSQEEVYSTQPVLQPLNNYLNNHFDEAFFSRQHYSYKSTVEVDPDGRLRPAYPGRDVNDNMDTTKYYHTAEVIMLADTSRFYLRNCGATTRNDTLSLMFTDDPFWGSLYELSAIKTKTSVSFTYDQTFSIHDTAYRRPVYSVLDQTLILDKPSYQKGDSLKGKLTATVSAFHSAYDTAYTETIKVYGLIKAVVQ